MPSTELARRRLDERLEPFRDRPLNRPHRGWIRAIREALGMSTAELGRRMGITQQSASAAEQAEERSTIQLATLQRAAAALDCELVYALVPRTSLQQTVDHRAREKAQQLITSVAHHSRLEDQEVSRSELDAQIEELAAGLVDRRGLWRDESP